MKIYINFNTEKKTLVIILKKNIFKLIINSVYGKTIENLRNRINVRLVNSAKYYKKYVRKPSFFHKKKLIKILLLFMRLNQLEHLLNQSM